MDLSPRISSLLKSLCRSSAICLFALVLFIPQSGAQSINQLFKERFGNSTTQSSDETQPKKPNSSLNQNPVKKLSPEEQKRKAEEAAEAKRQRDEAAAAAKERRALDAQRKAEEAIEQQRQREESAAMAKAQRDAEVQRQAQEAVDRQRQRDEAANAARVQRELERRVAPLVAAPVDSTEILLSAFDGTWVSIQPPGPLVNFFKVSFGSRQVSLPNLGHATVVSSDGNFGSNFKVSGAGFNCYYMVLFTAGYAKMVWDFKGGDNLCYSSAVFERTAGQR